MLFNLFAQVLADCTEAQTRVEWRQMQPIEQNNYLSAVQCLRQVPSAIDPAHGSPSRYDDFVWLHQEALKIAHSNHPSDDNSGSKNAHFLPWHRMYLHWYEVALRSLCGYQYRIPYWDWTYDGEDADNSPLWSEGAFGGSGWSDSCVHDGAFAGSQTRFPNPGCLSRNLQLSRNSAGFDAASVTTALHCESYLDFSETMYYIPHSYIHKYMGGSMSFLKAAPNDPIFFLHHANVDRIWAAWQARHPDANIQGDHVLDSEGRTKTEAQFTDILFNSNILEGLPNAQDYTIGDMWWTTGGPLCYSYSDIQDGVDYHLRRRSLKSCLKDLHVSSAPCQLMTKEHAAAFHLNGTLLAQIHAKEKKTCDFRDFIKKQISAGSMAAVGKKFTMDQFYQSFIKSSKK